MVKGCGDAAIGHVGQKARSSRQVGHEYFKHVVTIALLLRSRSTSSDRISPLSQFEVVSRPSPLASALDFFAIFQLS